MRDKLLFLLKYYLFWIVFSWVAKVVFLIYQYKETVTLTGHDYMMIFAKGFRMDLSFGGYVILLSCVLMAIGVFLSAKILKRIFLLPDAFAFGGIESDYRGRSGIIQELGVSHGCNSLVLLEDTRRGDGLNSDGVDSVALVTLCSHGGCFLCDLPPLGGQDSSYGQTRGIMAWCRISYFRWCCVYSRERRFQRGSNEREFRVFQ